MKTASLITAYLAAALFLAAAVLSIITGQTPMWQPITLIAAGTVFAGLGIYSHRQWKRSRS